MHPVTTHILLQANVSERQSLHGSMFNFKHKRRCCVRLLNTSRDSLLGKTFELSCMQYVYLFSCFLHLFVTPSLSKQTATVRLGALEVFFLPTGEFSFFRLLLLHASFLPFLTALGDSRHPWLKFSTSIQV